MVKNLQASAGDTGSIPASGRFPGVGNGNPLQYSCLENSMGIRAWPATVHGVSKSQTQLSEHTPSVYVNPHLPVYSCLLLSFLVTISLFSTFVRNDGN